MVANVGRETTPEIELRRALFACGLRFRKHTRPELRYGCKADVVFRSARVCVFADGCFWHGCPEHFATPKTNGSWWSEKIEDNRKRDLRQTRTLESLGWTVIRVWEHESAAEASRRISALVRERVNAQMLVTSS